MWRVLAVYICVSELSIAPLSTDIDMKDKFCVGGGGGGKQCPPPLPHSKIILCLHLCVIVIQLKKLRKEVLDPDLQKLYVDGIKLAI